MSGAPALSRAPGLNTVIAEIRLPENKAKDTHNLGKTTLGKLLDFCFLLGKDQYFFIFKHLDRFTSADKGHSYRKLLCIAFDMALIRAHLDQRFPRFVYHDGVLESLDDRKKDNLLTVIRAYADLGIQSVITLIDSDLPPRTEKEGSVFTTEELILTLHDENEQGRLFRMKPW
jgi:uncharacterized protein YydD (DUF2326 family)